MTTAPPPPIRSRVLGTIVTILALAASAIGCATAAPPTPVATPAARPSGTPPGMLVMVIRHGEKPDGSTGGVDAQGHDDSHSLTPTGWQRANRLVDLFDPVPGPPRPGLARPVAIYAATANDNGDGLRTRETVTPLADRLGITVNTTFGKGEERALVADVTARPGPTLISWQHEEIPNIAKAFPSTTPDPPSDWPDDRYDVVWTFTRTADGWHFAQLPELLLPGDRDTVIKG